MSSIVLNGKLYDAATGALIHAPKQTAHQPKPVVHKKTGLVVDGIQHPKHHKRTLHHSASKPKPVAKPHTTHPTATHHAHKPQKAATLMRQAVAKPQPVVHHQEKVPASIHDQRATERLERAKAVPRSNSIHRFPASHAATRPVAKTHASVAVQAAPKQAPIVHTPAPVVPLSASEKLVTNALKNARAHEATQTMAKKPKKRLSHSFSPKHHSARFALGGLAVAVLVGFFVYQNVPNFSMRVAATRAGFSAQLPTYKPSGFTQDKVVTYAPGKVTVSFHSNSDDRAFQFTQQVSNWNSQALADNYLAANDKDYQTFQANGKTIYVYDGTNATWVNGGVWYQVEGQASLTNEQLLKIANSI